MRNWITPLVFVSVVGVNAAQPPAGTGAADPPTIIITPKRPGDPPSPASSTPDPPGLIIIRPKGASPSTTPQPGPTPTPAPVAQPPTPAPVVPPVLTTAKEDGKGLFDYWFAAAVEGDRIGYLRWTGRELEQRGKKFWVGVKYQNFTISRFGQLVTQFGEESTVETPEGEVVSTSMRQGLGKDQALALSGMVDGKVLKIKGAGAAQGASDTPWPGGVTGITREPRLFKENQALKIGEKFEYLTYVPQVNRVVKVGVTFEGDETTALWPNTPPRKLLRFVSRMEPIQGEGGQKLTLPPATTWCDAVSAEPLRVEFDFPGLGGRVTFLRTTEAAAKAPVTNPPDLFKTQSIRLNREIPGIHTKAAVVYKVTLPRDDDPGTAFPADARQEIKNLDPKAKTLELHVSASHGPIKGTPQQAVPGGEFLGSSFFINWDNAEVKAHAAKAVAGLQADATAWEKAKAIEQWVHLNMRAIEFSQAMATADNVAKTLSGDCTEYAMLAAAMCRAVGVPSRTVLGLVYAKGADNKPYLAYHMWFEVFADSQWVPLDATLGMGGIGPGHVKITDHSWHNERSFAPLLPVLRVLMTRPGFEVSRVSP